MFIKDVSCSIIFYITHTFVLFCPVPHILCAVFQRFDIFLSFCLKMFPVIVAAILLFHTQ